MMFLTENNMCKKIYFLFLSLMLCCFHSNLLAAIPEAPTPPRLVNDFASLLNSQELQQLEQKLVAFSDSTSTQISIVTITSLDGYDIADFSFQLGKMGNRSKGHEQRSADCCCETRKKNIYRHRLWC